MTDPTGALAGSQRTVSVTLAAPETGHSVGVVMVRGHGVQGCAVVSPPGATTRASKRNPATCRSSRTSTRASMAPPTTTSRLAPIQATATAGDSSGSHSSRTVGGRAKSSPCSSRTENDKSPSVSSAAGIAPRKPPALSSNGISRWPVRTRAARSVLETRPAIRNSLPRSTRYGPCPGGNATVAPPA